MGNQCQQNVLAACKVAPHLMTQPERIGRICWHLPVVMMGPGSSEGGWYSRIAETYVTQLFIEAEGFERRYQG